MAQMGLEFMAMLLSQPPEYWDWCVLQCSTYNFQTPSVCFPLFCGPKLEYFPCGLLWYQFREPQLCELPFSPLPSLSPFHPPLSPSLPCCLVRVTIAAMKHHDRKIKLERKGFIQLTLLHGSPSLKEARSGTRTGQESGVRS